MEIYLDNCSTTKPREEVINVMIEALQNDYGNPSSLHRLGLNAEKKIETSRHKIADFLKVSPEEIYFTSGATESNNLAIKSILDKYSRKGKHIITTAIEHPSVMNTVRNFQEKGYSVTYLKVDSNGIISLDELANSIKPDTVLVSIMQVNNEVGSIQPTWKVKNIIKEKKSEAVLHVDGVQAFGKIPIRIKDWGIDAFSFSGHKIHGPKGIGGLYINKDLKLNPVIYGGNQERGFRSGTENVPGIIGLGKAVEIMSNNFEEERDHVRNLKLYFMDRLKEIEKIRINSPDEYSSPYILNVSFEYVRGEVLLHYLENKGIYVSTTSACSSKGTKKSHVLQELGLTDLQVEGAIRFCLSYDITKEDIDYTIDVLKDSVEEIRQVTMR